MRVSLRLFSLLLAASLTWGADSSDDKRYVNPVVFQRATLDTETGETLHGGKLWVMEADGSGLRQLTFGDTYDEHPSMYADQEHVLYAEFNAKSLVREAGANLIKLNMYDGKREVVAGQEGCALHHASLSPFEDLIAYHRDCGTRYAQVLGVGDDAHETVILAANGVRTRGGIIAMHEKNRGHSPREVALVHIRGRGKDTQVQVLTDGDVLHRRPAISPRGGLLAWQTNAAGGEDEIFLAEIDGSNPRNLTRAEGNDGHPWFSRDGQWIVFESDRTGNWEIWRIHVESGKQEQLTEGEGRFASTRARM